MKALLLFQFVISAITCLSQPLDKNVSILAIEGKKLYTGKNNGLGISYKVDTFKNILVIASQGRLISLDKYIHDLSLETKGRAIISVYDTTTGKSILLARRSFIVETYIPTKEEKAIKKLSEKVHISIEDFFEPRIPLSIIKKATQFKVTPPYKIKSATLYISRKETMALSLSSGNIDQDALTVWRLISPGCVITLDNVIVIDTHNKTHKINGRSFFVTDN
ncbi:MAG: hypothetical protein ABIO79_16310 [Ferruginibacter sp.]